MAFLLLPNAERDLPLLWKTRKITFEMPSSLFTGSLVVIRSKEGGECVCVFLKASKMMKSSMITGRRSSLLYFCCCLSLFVVAVVPSSRAWITVSFPSSAGARRARQKQEQGHPTPLLQAGSSAKNNDHDSWSTADNWNALSSENGRDSQDAILSNLIQQVDSPSSSTMSPHEAWLHERIDEILTGTYDDDDDDDESADATDGLHVESFLDDMGREIAMLVRCNQNAHQLMVEQGTALPEISHEQLYHPSQLVVVRAAAAAAAATAADKKNTDHLEEGGEWEATPFFKDSINLIFDTYAQPQAQGQPTTTSDEAASTSNDESDPNVIMILTANGVASWLQQCLEHEEGQGSQKRVGPHDWRVSTIVSKYGTYGTGYLTRQDFQDFYLQAIVGPAVESIQIQSHDDIVQYRPDALAAVWRDLRQHGILPPIQVERNRRLQELTNKNDDTDSASAVAATNHMIMDECEIIDYYDSSEHDSSSSSLSSTPRKQKASHEMVELASDGKTPLWIQDGDFVFIDEDSCIGCMQCALAAPASFHMLAYDGRARTYQQRPKAPDIVAAVQACPVRDCMHYVSFDELKELENARDLGDGRQDHRHFGTTKARGYIERKPLHVQRRESDANHQSSWYHYLKNKCHASTACPQRGCFDCPSYQHSGDNPYFQEKVRKATHARAEHFMETGEADKYRKTADI